MLCNFHWLEQHFVIELYNWGDIQRGQSGFLVHDVMRLSQKKDSVCMCVTFCADSCSCCSWEDIKPRHCSGSALHPGPVQRPARLHCPHPAAGHTRTSARYRFTLRELIKSVSLTVYSCCVLLRSMAYFTSWIQLGDHRDRERIVKKVKHVGWDKDNLIGQKMKEK